MKILIILFCVFCLYNNILQADIFQKKIIIKKQELIIIKERIKKKERNLQELIFQLEAAQNNYNEVKSKSIYLTISATVFLSVGMFIMPKLKTIAMRRIYLATTVGQYVGGFLTFSIPLYKYLAINKKLNQEKEKLEDLEYLNTQKIEKIEELELGFD